jgi:hypothetical protein
MLDLIGAKNKDLAWRLYPVGNRKARQRLKKRTRISASGLRAIRRRRNKLSKRKKSGRTRSQKPEQMR